MSDSRACVLDHNSLVELNNAIEYAADSVLKVRDAVDGYLCGVIEVMEHQLEYVAERFEEAKQQLAAAKERLAAAERALQSAQESMRSSMDGADDASSTIAGMAHGAASAAVVAGASAMVAAAKADCARAQHNYDKWEKNYETAKKIVSQCKGYKSDWEHDDIVVIERFDSRYGGGSHGGGRHLGLLGNQYTDEATKKLRKILEVIDKYLNTFISPNVRRNSEDVKVLDKYDKKKIIENSEFKVRQEQIDELNRHNAVAANRVAKCDRCGRPLSICVCGNTRKNSKLI